MNNIKTSQLVADIKTAISAHGIPIDEDLESKLLEVLARTRQEEAALDEFMSALGAISGQEKRTLNKPLVRIPEELTIEQQEFKNDSLAFSWILNNLTLYWEDPDQNEWALNSREAIDAAMLKYPAP